MNTIECGFWDPALLDWSTKDCSLIRIESNGLYLCECKHTTFFALIGVRQYYICLYFLFNFFLIFLPFKKIESIKCQ